MHSKMTAQNLSEKNKKEGCCSCSLDLNHVSCIAPPAGLSWTLKKKDPPKTNKRVGGKENKTGGEMMNQQTKQKSFLSLSLSLSLFISKGEPRTETLTLLQKSHKTACSCFALVLCVSVFCRTSLGFPKLLSFLLFFFPLFFQSSVTPALLPLVAHFFIY